MTAEWFYAKDNKRHGPVTEAQLRELVDSGQLLPTDLVWKAGMQNWAQASTVDGLFQQSSPPPLPAPPPLPVQTGNTASKSDQQVIELLKKGRQKFARGDYALAIEAFSEAIRLDPKNVEALFKRAETYQEIDQYDKSIADLTQVIQLNPNHGDAYRQRGFALLMQGHHQQAIDDASSALRIDPNDYHALDVRGSSYTSLKQYEKAIADLTRMVELRPSSARGFHARGFAHWLNRNDSAAITDLTRAIELREGNIHSFYYRGCAYFDAGNYREAIPDFERCLQPDSGLSGDLQQDARKRLEQAQQTQSAGSRGTGRSASGTPATSSVATSGTTGGKVVTKFLCVHCLTEYKGSLREGSTTTCDECGEAFVVRQYYGEVVDSLLSGLNPLSWFRSEQCPLCSSRNSACVGKKRLPGYRRGDKWLDPLVICYQCKDCRCTWIKSGATMTDWNG